MVERQLRNRGISDERVLAAMGRVPRELFVPEELRQYAYEDGALPIGSGQTISQPFIVATICALLALDGSERVLDVGTGSGYQAAVLSEVVGRVGDKAGKVFTIEIVTELAESAKKLLEKLGYANVQVKAGDGYRGWPSEAPFDAILVTAAPDKIPAPLVEQLKVGGRLVIPVGSFFQQLKVITKTKSGSTEQVATDVRFVPMTGEAQK